MYLNLVNTIKGVLDKTKAFQRKKDKDFLLRIIEPLADKIHQGFCILNRDRKFTLRLRFI